MRREKREESKEQFVKKILSDIQITGL